MSVAQNVEVQVQGGKWYQVVLSDGSSIGPDLRARVQASNPDAALRVVMRTNNMAFAVSASIWLLGRRGAPTQRFNVRCRIPVVRSA
jgi:hypothetical protein